MNHDPISGIVRKAVLNCVAVSHNFGNDISEPYTLFDSPEALVFKEEIIRAGQKLWQRQYVDGNGGNLSFRLSDEFVICTPTLCSKADLSLQDFVLVDLDNKRICGRRTQTSEILLHLEIYKAVPEARAVIHCHPPYATAHAIAGIVPPQNLIPEQEIFVGPVALAPYETPGTLEFAKTVLPFVKNHNTILLANHGIVCWGDTVAHAEWYVEVVETYCKTAMIAAQLSPKLNEIPPHKIPDLLAIKKKHGLPDARFATTEGDVSIDEADGGEKTFAPIFGMGARQNQIEALISRITDEIKQLINNRDE